MTKPGPGRMTALVRLARPGEEQLIAAVHIAAWRETYRGLFPDDFLAGLSLERRTEQWRRAIADRESELTLVEDGGTIVGLMHAGPPREVTIADGEIYAIYLLRSHQGRGLGHALVARAARLCRAGGAKTLGLWVLSSNAPACRFYEKIGGTIADRRRFDIGSVEYEEHAYLFGDLTRLESLAR